MIAADTLSSTFAALADPTRRAILAKLAKGESSVQKLAKPFDMSLPAVSKHLKVLERAGLIARSREAQWRPARLSAAPLKDISDWLASYKRFWEESFDRLDQYLRELQLSDTTRGMKKSVTSRRAKRPTNRRPHDRRQSPKRNSR